MLLCCGDPNPRRRSVGSSRNEARIVVQLDVDYDARVQVRALGDFALTRVGYGDLSFTRATARNVDPRDVERALSDGLDLGVTLVDVADEEPAQRLAGDTVRALRLRDRVLTAFRVPALASSRNALVDRYPAEYLQTAVENVLRITKLDALPLVQLALSPTWLSSPAWPELAGTCARLVREGKAMHWGAVVDDAARSTDEVLALAAEPWLASIHVHFNLCERAAEPLLRAASAPPEPEAEPEPPPPPAPTGLVVEASMLDLMSAMLASPLAGAIDPAALLGPLPTTTPAMPPKPPRPRALIFASRPLAGGMLAGTHAPGAKLALHDDRRTLDDATLGRVTEGIARLAAYVRQLPPAATATETARGIVERTKRREDLEVRTVAELALRFVLDHGAIALPRLHRREHVAETLALASAPRLPDWLHERLDEIFPTTTVAD